MRRRIWVGLAAVVVLAAAGIWTLLPRDDGYQLKIVLPDADGTYAGGKVMMQGRQVGQITSVGVQGNQAVVMVSVDRPDAPLHAGTTARVSWEALIGARVLELLPGATSNPDIPSGKMITSKYERVELDDLFATLDPPTRQRLQGLVAQLQQTLAGREPDLNATLKAAGPTVQALAEVMRGVGDDGPAIQELVTRLRGVTSALAARHTDLASTVGDLGSLTAVTAQKQEALKAALGELPSTVQQGTGTLTRVPGAVDAATPLVKDLRQPASRLPGVAGNLGPVLTELRPTVAALQPTLGAAQSLLQYTPGLLDTAHSTLPGLTQAVNQLEPAVGYLRPYTPELAGWLSNWTSLFASQSSGNYARILLTESATSFNGNPGIMPPGMQQDARPAPGANAGQPWTDANGDGVR